MPKRPNPFLDCSPLQFKTHVGVKELAMGSSRQEELMKAVYDKTHDKLFNAAQRHDVNDNNMFSSPPLPKHSLLDLGSQFEHTQTLLDSSGHLVLPVPLSSPGMAQKQCHDFHGWMDSCRSSACLDRQPQAASLPAGCGQMCLDANGQLTAPRQVEDAMDCDADSSVAGAQACAQPQAGLLRFGFQSKSKKQAAQGSQIVQVCETCRHLSAKHRCQFCERSVCQGCVRQCHNCSDFFCQLCSTLNYDSASERAYCLSCAG